MNRPSVIDIARRCKVSPSTVCRALNRGHEINAKTRARILQACDRLGYCKDNAASSLRLKQSNTLACLMPDLENELFVEKLHFLKASCRAAGFDWQLASFQNQEEAENQLRRLVSSRPAGIILSCALSDSMRHLIARNQIPVAGCDLDDPLCDCVALDRIAGCRQAINHLFQQQRRRILLLGSSLKNERGIAYQQAHDEHQIPIDPALIHAIPFARNLYEYGHEQTRARLKQSSFDAIFAVNDACAIGAMRALHEAGLSVPGQVAVVGFDNIMAAPFHRPSLTTVAQPKEELAQQSIAFLMARIQKPSIPRQFIRLPTQLIVRESSQPSAIASSLHP
ncbi:MAG: LacI family DNA-binding transcriptional regulator [Verrucomicrobiae bacterium]|nr:LacI family DNA-binding transcriptional regulator [Verrucomicrobiae bacterium]